MDNLMLLLFFVFKTKVSIWHDKCLPAMMTIIIIIFVHIVHIVIPVLWANLHKDEHKNPHNVLCYIHSHVPWMCCISYQNNPFTCIQAKHSQLIEIWKVICAVSFSHTPFPNLCSFFRMPFLPYIWVSNYNDELFVTYKYTNIWHIAIETVPKTVGTLKLYANVCVCSNFYKFS